MAIKSQHFSFSVFRLFPRHPVVRFIGSFAALLAAFYIIVLLPAVDRAFYHYLVANAWIANVILHGFGQTTTLTDVTIRSSSYAISVRRGCDGIEPAWLFAAAVVAFPSTWQRKLKILPLGIALILVLNLIRIVSLYFIGRWAPSFFPTAHLELWPAAFILVALSLWLAWIRGVAGNAEKLTCRN